jgi:hypothetical protein
MPDGHFHYIPLISLVADWGRGSGTPAEMILRNVCEWAVVGGFPVGAFVKSSGEKVMPLDLLTATRALTGNGQATIGDLTVHIDPRVAWQLLSSVLITENAALQFCEHTGTLPPPSLLRGFKRLVKKLGSRTRLDPLECPAAHEHAARQLAFCQAAAGLNTLREYILGLEGEPTRFGPRRTDDLPDSLEFWSPKWKKMRDHTDEYVRRCGDQALQKELEALEREWEQFVVEPSRRAESASEERGDTVGNVTPMEVSAKPAASDQPSQREPRLRIWKSTRCVELDKVTLILTPRSFEFLRVLMEGAAKSTIPVFKEHLEKLVTGDSIKLVGQAIYALKQELIRAGVKADCAESLIENIRGVGYRLILSATDIRIEE